MVKSGRSFVANAAPSAPAFCILLLALAPTVHLLSSAVRIIQ